MSVDEEVQGAEKALGEKLTRADVGVDWNRPSQAESWDVSSHPMELPQAPSGQVDWRSLAETAFGKDMHWDTPAGRLWAGVLDEVDMLRLVAHWQGAGLSKLAEDTFAVYSGMFEMLTRAQARITDLEMQVESLKVQRASAIR